MSWLDCVSSTHRPVVCNKCTSWWPKEKSTISKLALPASVTCRRPQLIRVDSAERIESKSRPVRFVWPSAKPVPVPRFSRHGRRSHRSWGTWPPLLKAKGDRGTQFGDNWNFTYSSYHAFTLMSMPQIYELGWLSYLSNILSPNGQKVGGQKIFSARFARRICPPPLSKPWRRPCFQVELPSVQLQKRFLKFLSRL